MQKIKDIYIKMFLGALIVFAFGLAYLLADIFTRVGDMEHDMMHMKNGSKTICSRR